MKGQTALEFVMLVAVAFLILLVYTASTRQDLLVAESAKEHALVKDLAYSLQSEINRIGPLENGYQRTFILPLTLDGKPYTVQIDKKTIIVNTSDYEYLLSILPVTGDFVVGQNTIKKESGEILLNQ